MEFISCRHSFLQKQQERRKTKIKKPKTITNEDAEKIRRLLNTQDRLIFDLSLETGCRISDILKLRRNQIQKTMTIYESKTKKHKMVTVSDELLRRLPKGFAFGAQNYAFPSPTSPGKHIHRSTYHRHLKNACRPLKIDFSAHSTRKLYAWNVFDVSEDISDVQKALQHKFVNTTAKYMDIDLTQVINAELIARKRATQSHGK